MAQGPGLTINYIWVWSSKGSLSICAVLGCGPVGLLAVGIAKAMGATKVYVRIFLNSYLIRYCSYSYAADIVEGRLKSAKLIGADVIINCKIESLRERSM